MIQDNFKHYNIISFNNIYYAYLSMLQQTDENPIYKALLDSNKIYNFTYNLFKCSSKFEKDSNFILDMSYIDLNKALELSKETNSILLVFGFTNISLSESLNILNQYSTLNDWTSIASDYIKELYMKKSLLNSKEYYEFCKDNNIIFVNTSRNRDKVLNDLLRKISKII